MLTFTQNASARHIPRLPYEDIKKDILGTQYVLTLNFVGSKRAKQLNTTYRKKSYVPNVLSFPLYATQGELYLTPVVIKREAPLFDHSYKNHMAYLYIHGLLHLKGYDHGDAMERLESKYCKKYHVA